MVSSLIIVFTLLSGSPDAQQRYPYYQGWRFNLNVGSTNFTGDIRNNRNGFFDNTPLSKFFYQDRKFAAGLRLEKRYTYLTKDLK